VLLSYWFNLIFSFSSVFLKIKIDVNLAYRYEIARPWKRDENCIWNSVNSL
jgi:hypothetical protein